MGNRKPRHEAMAKEAQVFNYRLLGVPWKDIAEKVGYKDESGAIKAYKRACLRNYREETDEMRDLDNARLDKLTQFWLPKVFDKNTPVDEAKAITEVMLKIMDRKAKNNGIAITKVEQDITIYEGGSEIDQRVKELAYLVANSKGTDTSRLDGGISANMA